MADFWSLFHTLNARWRPDSPLPYCKTTQFTPASLKDAKALASTLPNLYSPNETAEDLPTSSLKYVLASFILAQALENDGYDPETRVANLLSAKLQYSLFAVDALRLYRDTPYGKRAQVLWDQTVDQNKRDISDYDSAAMRRSQVIERKRLTQELDDRSELLASAGLKEEDSAEGREFWQLLTMRFLVDAAAALEMIQKELEILAQRARAPEIEQDRKEADPERLRLDGYGEVLKKPFIIKIANSAELRKLYASEVFRPGHILPTVSLAEVAAAEMAMEVDGLGAAQKREAAPLTEEQREAKARAWDDWKDANPRGSGNKMVNRG